MKFNFTDLFKDEKRGLDPSLENIIKQIYFDSTFDKGPWIAGGMGRQLALGETEFADIDIWFSSPFQFEQVYRRLADQFTNSLYEVYSSDNASTYQLGQYKVQLIKRAYYPSLQAVFDNFDFTCCQVAVMPDLSIAGPGIEDAKNYTLKLNKLDTKAFLARYGKYVSYGYKMNPDEFIKIINTETLNYEFDGSVFGY
jgi:hypothetical protein